MKLFKMLALLAGIGLAGPAAADIHKCIEQDGKTTWTDKPCTVYRPATAPAPAQPGADAAAPAATSVAPAQSSPGQSAAQPAAAPQAAPAAPAPSSEPAASAAPAAPKDDRPAGSYIQPQGSSEPAEPSPREQEQTRQAQQQAIEEEFVRRFKRKSGLLLLGGVLMFAAWIMHIVAAVKLEKIAWAICLFLFSPFSNIPFTVLYWQKAKLGFFVYVGGFVIMIATVVSLYSGLVPT